MPHRQAVAAALLCFLIASVALGQDDRGVTLYEEGKTREARAHFEARLRANPADPAAAYWLGRILLDADDAPKAAEWLEKAVKLKPATGEYHLWLGRAYGRKAMKGNVFTQASLAGKIRDEFEKAVQLDPESVDARTSLLEFYMIAPKLVGGSEEKAMAQAAEIARRDPVAGVRQTARVHLAKGRQAEAERVYIEGIRRLHGHRELRRDLAFSYQQRKHWSAARDIFKSLVADDPTDMAARYQIGRTAALSGLFLDEGEQALRAYLGHTPKGGDPTIEWAHVRLGAIYEAKKRPDLARAEYQRAIAIKPDLKEAKAALARLR